MNLSEEIINLKTKNTLSYINSYTLGVLEPGLTCPIDLTDMIDCPGYFGHIELTKPVYNLNYIDSIVKVLKCVNYYTSKLLLKEKSNAIVKIKKEKNFKKRLEYLSNMSKSVKVDSFSGESLPSYFVDGPKVFISFPNVNKNIRNSSTILQKIELMPEQAYRILKNISKKDCKTLGFDYINVRPSWLIIFNLPVPPISVRPFCKKNVISRCEDDLTYKLNDILSINIRLKETMASKKPFTLVNHYRNLLSFHIATYHNNSTNRYPLSTQRSGKPIKGIIQRIVGKFGRIRRNLLGKRVDFSARSVITGDISVKLSEIGVPKIIKKKLTINEIVNKYNIERLSTIVDSISDELKANYVIKGVNKKIDLRLKQSSSIILLKYGFIVVRHIDNGDHLILNRQPSLHKMSMMGHRVKIMPKMTLRLNLSVTPPYNADFDGDEMNIHVPQGINASIEVKEIMSVTKNIVSPQSNKPVIGVVQDSLVSNFILASKDSFLRRSLMLELIQEFPKLHINHIIPTIIYPVSLWSGKQLYSLIVKKIKILKKPKKFKKRQWFFSTMKDSMLFVSNGQIITGNLHKSTVGTSRNSIIHKIWSEYSNRKCEQFIDDNQALSSKFILFHGFTISCRDFKTDLFNQKITDLMKNNSLKKYFSFQRSYILDNIFQISYSWDSSDSDISLILIDMKEILKITEIVFVGTAGNNNNMFKMIESGSKGTMLNVIQIMGSLGQQSVVDARKLANNVLSHFPYFSYKFFPISYTGYVKNCFYNGLNTFEFFYHAISGREGIIDTSIKTAETGYIQRKLSKSMENLIGHYDGSLRNAMDIIIQFLYGEDGFDPTLLENHKISSIDSRKYEEKSYNKWKMMHHIINKKSIFRNTNKITANLFSFKLLKMIRSVFVPFDLLKIIVESRKKNILAKRTNISKSRVNIYTKTISKLLNIMISRGAKKNNINGLFTKVPSLCIIYVCSYLNIKFLESLGIDFKALMLLKRKVVCKYFKSLVTPGECLGVISAQSIGEPTTQMTLNTFHYAGIAEKDVTRGLPRFNEIINSAKHIKSPRTYLSLKSNMILETEGINFILSRINQLNLEDLIIDINCLYIETIDFLIKNLHQTFRMPLIEDIINHETKNHYNKWIFYINLKKHKLLEHKINLKYIIRRINNHFKKNIIILCTDENRTRPKIGLIFKNINFFMHDLAIPFNVSGLLNEIKIELLSIRVQGIDNLKNPTVLQKLKSNYYYYHQERYISNIIDNQILIDVIGINLAKASSFPWVDQRFIYSNDINSIFDNYGIEASLIILSYELKKILEFDNSYVNQHHISALIEYMTNIGFINSISRHGMKFQSLSSLQECSFEETSKILMMASLYGRIDRLNTVTEKIIVGDISRIGTGYFGVKVVKSDYLNQLNKIYYKVQNFVDSRGYFKISENGEKVLKRTWKDKRRFYDMPFLKHNSVGKKYQEWDF